MSKPALVIFDLDNTILNGDSDYAMINYLVHTQALDESAGKQNQIFIEDYQRGELDFDAYTTFALSAYIGMTRSEINEYMLPFVAKVIEPMINTLALKIIHDHGRSEGMPFFLQVLQTSLLFEPIAERLDIQNVIGTQVKFI